MECAYCSIEFEEDEEVGMGLEKTPEGVMHESCYIDWRDD